MSEQHSSCVHREKPRRGVLRDLIGRKFGRWSVIAFCGVSNTNAKWLCRCECGVEKSVAGYSLIQGQSTSFGCAFPSRGNLKHGLSRSKLYRTWCGMIRRCHDPSSRQYKNSGNRGIIVCDEWRSSVEAFSRFIGQPPSPRHELDRINNDGNYEPGNVRWVTHSRNNRNTRRTTMVVWSGKLMALRDVAEHFGLNFDRVRSHIRRGKTIQEVIGLLVKDA